MGTLSDIMFATMKKHVEAEDCESMFSKVNECTAATPASKSVSITSDWKSLSAKERRKEKVS